MTTRPPNVLLIMSDQEQHWSSLPSAMSRPGLDWLLTRGTGFTRHHVVTLPCGPSRSVIYTGQHTPHTKVLGNPNRARGIGLSPTLPTLGSMLREQGYYTAYKGKWHVSVIDPPTRFSGTTAGALEEFCFAEYTADGDPVGIPWDGYRQDPAVASDAANWLLGRGGHKPDDQPWFLAVNFVNPHDIMFFDATGRMNRTASSAMPAPRLPAPYAPLYQREWDVELPGSFHEDLSGKPAAQAHLARSIAALLGDMPREDEASWRAFRDYYYNCLIDLDQHVSTVLRALVAADHDRDTVVIYTTDHGEAAGAHGLREKPTSVYRELVNVPLVVVHPDVAGGATTSALSSSVDLAPSILSMIGMDTAERADRYPALRGHDLGPVVADPAAAGTREETGVLFCMSRIPSRPTPDREEDEQRMFLRGIFDGRWKFARYFAPEDHHRAVDWDDLAGRNDLELYDTTADPDEVNNLAADPAHHDVITRLAGQLTALIDAEVGVDDGSDLLALTPASASNGHLAAPR